MRQDENLFLNGLDSEAIIPDGFLDGLAYVPTPLVYSENLLFLVLQHISVIYNRIVVK